MMRRRISRAQQTKNWCVGFSFPPPAYAGIHPTLYLFGFRADALNSHSPPYLPGFDPRSCLERFDTFSGSSGKVVGFSCRGLRSSETVRGPPGPLGGFRGPLVGAPIWRPPAGLSGRLRGASGRLRGPRGASGGPRGGLRGFFWVWTLGLVVGFAFFGLRPQPPAWRIPNFSIFQATSWRRLASGPPERRPGRCLQKTPRDAPGTPPGRPPRTPLGRFPGRSRTPPQGPGGPPGSPKTLETPQMRPLQGL